MVHRERGPETDARGGSFRGGESELSSSGAVVSMHFGKERGRGPKGPGLEEEEAGVSGGTEEGPRGWSWNHPSGISRSMVGFDAP